MPLADPDMGPIEISQCSGFRPLCYLFGSEPTAPIQVTSQMRMRIGGMRWREILADLWGAAVCQWWRVRNSPRNSTPSVSDDHTIAIEYRWADGRNEHLAEFAADFVRWEVDVIVTSVTAHRCGKTGNTCDSVVFAC
jgi:hypothetical protein